MSTTNDVAAGECKAMLTRRRLLGGGGVLLVGFGFAGSGCSDPQTTPQLLGGMGIDPTNPTSWVEIRADNTIVMRTGNSDFGQGTIFTAYRQIVAEELRTTVEAITTIVTGDTDRTPDGGGSYEFLGSGSPNIRKAAAYVFQALLDLGAERLGVPRHQLAGRNGALTGAGRTVTYGELVSGQELKLSIPVIEAWPRGLMIGGNPPTKPVSQYTIIGKSIDNTATTTKVTAHETWLADIRLPNMLHARIVRPPAFGATLVSAGAVDSSRFPNAKLVVKQNLVAVVAPAEWEAVRAAAQVAADTRWTSWKGLPANDELGEALRRCDWASTPVQKDGKDDVSGQLAGAATTLEASYFIPYMKHAPIGPSMAVADVKPDGTAWVYAHVQNAQMLRRQIARMLSAPLDKVVVRCFPGPGHYGRSNGGSAGGEDEAVILSKELGSPVRVQWSRAEDFQWSAQAPAGVSDIEIGLDADGRMIAYQADHYMPSMFDSRPIGAILAGLPVEPPPSETAELVASTTNLMWDKWIYADTENFSQRGHGARQIGESASPNRIGLRGHSLRTPGHFQQNYPRELAISEAAALAGRDPLQFRIDHATDPRVVGVLEAVRDAAGWQHRPSPATGASSMGDRVLHGRGVSAIFRQGTHWACACEIVVTPATGVIRVEKVTLAVDPGIVINPRQLNRQAQGGMVMGISHALREEVQFDESVVTSSDWASYPILTMADTPEIDVVLLHRPEVGAYGGGSEAANALPAPAIAAALHDATGVFVRRLPLTPDHVRTLLRA